MAVDVGTLNRVRYSGLDFATGEDEILTRLQVNFASVYNDFAVSSLGIMLIDLFAFGLDTLSFYLDRRATDNYLSTARTRKSVAKLARQLGYKMSPATAASIDLVIRPVAAQSFLVPLPLGFQMRSPDGSIWEAQQAYTWPIGNADAQTLTFSQTQTLQSVFTSGGTANQVFKISNIIDGEFLVGPGSDGVSQIACEIDGDVWTENELLTFGETNQFEIGYHDTPPTFRLGDGIAGNLPANGRQIRLTYKSSRGPLGSVTAGQTIEPVRQLVASFTNIPLIVTNPLGSSGGSQPESIEKAKANAPVFFKSRGVNITKEDYNVRSSSFIDSVFGAIAVASAITVRGASSDSLLQGLMADIVSTSETFQDTVDAAVAVVSPLLATSSEAIVSAQEDSASIAVEISDIASESASSQAIANTILTSSAMISVFLTQISGAASTMTSTVDGITLGGSDQLTTSTSSTLASLFALVQAAANNCTSQASSITSNLGTIAESLGTIGTDADGIASTQANMDSSLSIASAGVSSATTNVTALAVDIAAIDNDIESLSTQVLDHVDSFLSSDCQSNLVEVPVLAFDSDGFYVGPTIGLMKSLQAYLEAKKELTQVVKVLSGVNLLVAADVAVHVGVLQGYVESIIKSQVEAAVLGVLKKREFGKDLQLSEFYWVLHPDTSAIKGVSFVNVSIDGPVDRVDLDGDLPIDDNEVVTRGTIAITSEVVVQS